MDIKGTDASEANTANNLNPLTNPLINDCVDLVIKAFTLSYMTQRNQQDENDREIQSSVSSQIFTQSS